VRREELIAQIKAFRDFPNFNVAHPGRAVTLYCWLIEPFKEHLPPHLAIVPHSVLHYLPFAALTDGERYLIDDYTLTTLPSASVLPFIRDNTGRELTSPLILGNPATEALNLRPLTYAEWEAQTIAKLYNAQPLLGEAATESAVRERASQAGILHLAAHGEFNVYSPLYSTLYLAPDDENDGRLEVHEVYGLDLKNADLVVLSACQTQLGHELEAEKPLGVTLGDEIVGFGRAFIYAGTPSIISTLWSVDDQSTGMLTERFYAYLQEGMGKAEALRQAQLDVRAEYPNPYFWSGFVLSGDPGGKSGYKPPARETATPLPPAEATTAPVEETPKAEETSAPTKGGGGLCPVGALILALGVGVAFIANGRRYYV
jgi:CHAT domain-containing protein